MIALLIGTLKRSLIELRRYAFDTVFQVGSLYILFVLVFFGARSIGGPTVREGETLPSIVVGFVVFFLVIFGYGTLSGWMTTESTLGTLEQIAMSPLGILSVLFAEYVSMIVVQVVLVGSLLLAAEATSGQWLHLDVVTLVPLVVLLLLQVLGISLALAGAALVFKRIASFANIIQFGFLALIATPVSVYPFLRYLPLSLGNELIRQTTVRGTSIAQLPRGDLMLVAMLAVISTLIGVVIFRRAEAVARDRGVIGVY
jgi:ABC-2 type transport system permease protein